MPPIGVIVGEQPPSLMRAIVQHAGAQLGPLPGGQGGTRLPRLGQNRQQVSKILIVPGGITGQVCGLQFHERGAKHVRARDNAGLAVGFYLDSLRPVKRLSSTWYLDCPARRSRREVCPRANMVGR